MASRRFAHVHFTHARKRKRAHSRAQRGSLLNSYVNLAFNVSVTSDSENDASKHPVCLWRLPAPTRACDSSEGYRCIARMYIGAWRVARTNIVDANAHTPRANDWRSGVCALCAWGVFDVARVHARCDARSHPRPNPRPEADYGCGLTWLYLRVGATPCADGANVL